MLDCKFKKKKRNRKLFFPIRLRGGANNEGCSMIDKAIANAKAHNINVTAGDRTLRDGNCIFGSVLKNLNSRNYLRIKSIRNIRNLRNSKEIEFL